MRYRRNSDHSPPCLNVVNRNTALNRFDRIRQWLYRSARNSRGQGVSMNYKEVLRVLLSFAERFGRVYPSHQTIANQACCSIKTVQRALAWLKAYGFLSWQRRIRHTHNPRGIRQTSNAYKIICNATELPWNKQKYEKASEQEAVVCSTLELVEADNFNGSEFLEVV